MDQFSKELDNLGGAAVRGEAVAEAWKYRTKNSDRWLVTMQEGWVKSLDGAEVIALAPVSARAADAPSEPSECVMRAALQRIARWHGEFPDTGKTWPTGGAVSYAAEYGSNGERDYMRQIALDALKSRAADALDSQPQTASQGIGGDDQYRSLMDRVITSVKSAYTPSGIDHMETAITALTDYIDSRASSAPVAPIAPDDLPLFDRETTSDDYGVINLAAKYSAARQFGREFSESGLLSFIDVLVNPQQEGSEAGNG